MNAGNWNCSLSNEEICELRSPERKQVSEAGFAASPLGKINTEKILSGKCECYFMAQITQHRFKAVKLAILIFFFKVGSHSSPVPFSLGMVR